MAGNSQQSNKYRSSNFCKEETNKLMSLLRDYPIITNKKTDHASNQQKEAAWRLLADKFNSDAAKYRSIKQLQQKYNNMKKIARKEMATEKYGRRQTGGGPAPPGPSDTTEWLNTIMGESICGLPAIYDSDALDNTEIDVVPVMENKTANGNFDSSKNKLEEESILQTSFNNDFIFTETELVEENVPIDNESKKTNQFDSSTPKAMLRTPVSKELSFNVKKRKAAFTPLETRKRIILHADKKIDFLTQKQLRERNLVQYAQEEHEQTLRHREELHQIELECKKKILEKCIYETEKAKLDLNKTKELN